jgi:hypothetical protein
MLCPRRARATLSPQEEEQRVVPASPPLATDRLPPIRPRIRQLTEYYTKVTTISSRLAEE